MTQAKPPLLVRQALPEDAGTVASILQEAAQWLVGRGIPLWRGDELTMAQIVPDVDAGHFFLAEQDGAAVGTVRFQLEDPDFWPDVPAGESAFLHRLAVRRSVAGGDVSKEILQWAARRARDLGKRFLRLDCEASRPRLRAIYERQGFRHHSDRQVGPYFVARYEVDLLQP